MMKFKNHMIAVLVIVLIFVNFITTTIMSISVVYSTVSDNEKEMVESLTQNVYEAIRKELQEPITVGRAVVSTETLINLLENEDEYTQDELAEIFKTYLKNYQHNFDYNTISIVSNKTGNYYTQLGFNKTIDPENDEHDIWYKSFIEANKEYDFDIDVDEVNQNKWTLFMNIRIIGHDGQLLGVSGLGVDLSYLQDIIADLEEQYGITVTFTNMEGTLQLGSDSNSVTDRILSETPLKTNNYYTSTKIFEDRYTVSKPLKDLGWIIIVTKENKLKEYTLDIVKNNLIIMAILMLIVVIIVTVSIVKSQDVLMKASEEAHKASEAKGQFLASMSHEIRTPINGILGMDEMLLKICTNEKQIEYAKNIQSAGKTLLSLINDILDVSKIEAGKMEIIDVDYDLFSVFNDCYNINVFRVRNKGLDFKMNIDPKLPANLHGDEVRIRQVINNLLSNAAKYTSEGEISLDANYEDIDESTILLKIKVIDTGMGIKPEDMDKLFESFTRVDEEKNRNIEGTGLGLNLCHNLAKLMGGRIDVESKYGVGSTFIITIPQRVVSREAMGDFGEKYKEYAKNIEAKKIEINAPNAKVLIVDDVEMNLMVAKGLLENTGLDIETVTSGEKCLEKMLANDYDIVFLDHMMPEMDGVETLKKWLTLERNHNENTPVIMLTANALSGAREEYINVGFTDYLSKPIDENELKAMLVKYLPKNKLLVSEKSSYEEVDIDMITWGKELEDRYERLYEGKKVNVRVWIDPNLPLCMSGNKDTLDEVLNNLVEEAVLHTDAGKIVVKISKSEDSEDEIVTVDYSVIDTGDKYNSNSQYVIKAKEELIKLDCGLYISSVANLGASASFLYKQMAKSKENIGDVAEGNDNNVVAESIENHTEKNEIDELVIEGVEVEKGLELVQGMKELYLKILKSFVKSSSEFDITLKNSFVENDLKNYRIGAHSIKSQSYSIGAAKLGDLAKSMEYAARDEDKSFIEENHQEFMSMISVIRENVISALANQGIEAIEKAETEIDKLIAAIDDFEMEKALEILEIIDGDEEIIGNIRQALDEYDYFDAHDFAEKLR